MAHHALRRVSLVFFFAYVASLIGAGAWGMVGARVDMRVLLRLHIHDLPDRTAANLLSQYRFELVGIVLIFLATRSGLADA